MSSYSNPINLIKTSLISCFYSCKQAHTFALSDDSSLQIHACIHANTALSHLACAKSVYAYNFEQIQNDIIESLMLQIQTFCDELISNFSEDHSHQWTDIEFDRLKDMFIESGYWDSL